MVGQQMVLVLKYVFNDGYTVWCQISERLFSEKFGVGDSEI
jgi:hypothetical protein